MLLRKIFILLFSIIILSGCATYKFQKPTADGAQGYLVSYDNKPIIEYTVGKEKSLPDLTLAKERFKRRRPVVEYYYKKMGKIESRLKENLWGFPVMLVEFVGGVLRWPCIAIADYRYNHNPKYKERVDKLEEENDAFEKVRVNSLEEKLQAYIVEDLVKENLRQGRAIAEPVKIKIEQQSSSVVSQPLSEAPAPVVEETVSKPVVEQASLPVVLVTPPVEVKQLSKPVLEPPIAVIIAKPTKGYSALKVNFSAQKSYSKSGKIVSYFWDFGDGDTSTKKNSENTYWSTTYGSRKFTATLTVKDEAGNVSSATAEIEVITR